MLTAIAMMSAENIFYRPGGSGVEGGSGNSSKAAAAHKRFASFEGDFPTLIAVYDSWRREAIYDSSSKRKIKAQKLMKHEQDTAKNDGRGAKILHGDWCTRNFISGRALVRAHDVRNQLVEICGRNSDRNGLGMDTKLSCGADDMINFLKCTCAGLFLHSASRVKNAVEINKEIRKQMATDSDKSTRGRYKTKIGGREVSIHPTSSLFGRNPPPKCVVYTELQITKKAYIRGVTQIKEGWLGELAPAFFK